MKRRLLMGIVGWIMYRDFFKRLLDTLFAVTLIIMASPLLLICALCIKILEPADRVVFAQPRLGYKNQLFTIYKFRTLRSAKTDKQGRELSSPERLTRHGRIMRKLSLDELPQLFNVLVGQMSFIGPRPLLPQYLPFYTPTEIRRHEVRPGISGWAQVNGRNAVTWGQRLAMDVWYVDNQSLGLDIRIFFMTVLKVIKREGIGAAGRDTSMPAFRGSAVDYSESATVKQQPTGKTPGL